VALRKPIFLTFVGCCASADAQSARSMAPSAKGSSFLLFIFFSRSSAFRLTAHCLSNHPIRSRQYIWRNRQADLFSGSKIHLKLKLHWLLHREIGCLSTF